MTKDDNDMRTDFDTLDNFDLIRLFPNDRNPIHKEPVEVMYLDGGFYGEESDEEEGPDYHLGDVLKFNDGFEMVEKA